MKIFSTVQIREWDNFTIKNELIDSIDLMERASAAFVSWFVKQFPSEDRPIYIFCGNGNNGGDGLAIARLLHRQFYIVRPYIFSLSDKRSLDNQNNLTAAQKIDDLKMVELKESDIFPTIEKEAIIIDAILGSGLTKPLKGYFKKIVQYLNQQKAIRVAVDMPTGLFGEKHTTGIAFEADFTFSFQQPKLAFFLPENYKAVGEWRFQSIGLSKEYYASTPTTNYLINPTLIQTILKVRNKFDHKGTYGHTLLIMGSYGKMGAIILASMACIRSGCGLVTAHIPKCGYDIMQIAIPEVMTIVDVHEKHFTKAPKIDNYKAIGIGCGLGTSKITALALTEILELANQPLLLDADALNIISKDSTLFSKIPKNSILTPHPKEFERLFGKSKNDFERNHLQVLKAKELQVFILLKGANTCVATPDSQCYFNTSGNPGMATAGSGDVLSGIITSLLAQGYHSLEACLLGVYLHGLAGDIAAKEIGQEAMIASDIIAQLGKAFQIIKEK